MAKNYTVVWGDTLTKIATNHGFDDWRVIYNHPSNAAFKAKRPNPDKIFVGDVIVIPDLPGSSPVTPPSPSSPQRGPNAFFVTADVRAGQTVGAVLSTFGLDRAGQLDALRDPHNAHLHGNLAGAASDTQLATLLEAPMAIDNTVVIPIDVRLSVQLFERFETLFPTGNETSATHHGVRVRIGRNLLSGTALNWIQTVRKLNNPDKKAPVEFVDIGINNEPFFDFSLPRGTPAPRVFSDEPLAPVGSLVDFTAMTTLAVLVRGHIILAAGTVWRYVITTAPTLPDSVRTTPPRDATAADFQNQLRILRLGQNQLRGSTGPNLDYVVRPAPGTVIK